MADNSSPTAGPEEAKLLEWVNQSGFPFQTALEALVNGTQTEWKWKVKLTEEGWKNLEDGKEGFIDLVLQNEPGSMSLVVEAKRTLDACWVFLVPDKKHMSRRHLKGWLTWSGEMPFCGWRDVTLSPASPESQFCVVRGQDNKAVPMLERVAGDLVSSTEALALEEKPFVERRKHEMRLYCSVIVTTATLKVCEYDPGGIPLDLGKITDATFTEVPVVRFRKQLSTRKVQRPVLLHLDEHSQTRLKEHTVFVINALHFMDFLHAFDIDAASTRNLQ